MTRAQRRAQEREIAKIRSMKKTPSKKHEGVEYPFEFVVRADDNTGREFSVFAYNDAQFEELLHYFFEKWGFGITDISVV